jgi:Xaa-Pro aminopeptidase
MNNSKTKLTKLRALMEKRDIDAYLIPNTDPHLGEYIPDHWKIVEWLTGFTGSAANVVVTKSFAGLWTDSRYFIQVKKQLDNTGFRLMKVNVLPDLSISEWLLNNLKKGKKIGVDGRLISIRYLRHLKEVFAGKEVTYDIEADLISDLWDNRPPLPDSIAFDYAVDYTGKAREIKITDVRDQMKIKDVNYHLLTSLDDIMWLLNIRANDIQYSPLLISFAILKEDQLLFFTDEKKISIKLASEFDKIGIVILPYEEISSVLSAIPTGSSIHLAPKTTSASLFYSIRGGVNFVEDISIPSRLKAIKNNIEIKNIRNVMLKDGIALTKFFFWLEKNIEKIRITELSSAQKLFDLRMQQVNCTGPSFSTIAAFNEHSAMPHYSADSESDAEIKPGGIFLVDSGGQYLDGTTDITRSVALGRPSDRQKTDFTLVLKGTIGIAMAKFPVGTRGYQIDILARKSLWENGLNYGHGTGHGVGFFLNVHEGPQSIGSSATDDQNICLEKGMLLSDEPAIYRERSYGFRTENIVLVVEAETTAYGQFLKFETLSLCFIDKALIDRSILDNNEILWLNNYHSMVYNKISSFLSNEERVWFEEKTREF